MSGFAELGYAKLNLALHVRGRRDDGYHEIETVFAFCENGDELRAEPSSGISLTVGGPFGGGLEGQENIVLQAARRLREVSGTTAGAAIALNKALPVAAGLGGGSADAAAALRLLDRMWGCGLDRAALQAIAGELGADVPACLESVSARGTGRGDLLEPADLGLAGRPVLLVNPRMPLATAEVFAGWDGVDRGPLGDWRDGRNDLQEAAIALVPQIETMLAWLSAQRGSDFVRMSGSGATCFALFADAGARDRAAEAVPREWWHLSTALR